MVIPDVRFPNEAKMIYGINGQVWRVKRDKDPDWFTEYQTLGVEPKEVHPSEWAWANTKFTNVLENNKVNDLLRSQAVGHLASSVYLLFELYAGS